MILVAQIIGFVAVGVFLLSFQPKQRKYMIVLNVTSRVLYVLQYLLLGALSGAVMDVLGSVSAILASKKHTPFVKKYEKLLLAVINALIVAAGVAIAVANKRWIDLLAVVGVLLHTCAFWLTDETQIRWVSLVGSPFWCTYDILSRAYGPAVGDALSMASIIIALIRHRKGKKTAEQ